jgi:carboxyl-terminal processing protease
MTVTIAKYLTPSNRDIHKHGIAPDVSVKLTEDDAKRLKIEDLGTSKDPQYKTAESTLMMQLRMVGNNSGPIYQPGTANVPAALGKP